MSTWERSVLWVDMFDCRAAVSSAFERAVGRARIGEWPPMILLGMLVNGMFGQEAGYVRCGEYQSHGGRFWSHGCSV